MQLGCLNVPHWLAIRRLNDHLCARGFLPRDMGVDDLLNMLDEENGYDGEYTPDLLCMLNGVDRAFLHYYRHDKLFYREIFEQWYFNTFAPNVFDRKLPAEPPPVYHRSGGRGCSVMVLLAFVCIAVLLLADAILGCKMLTRLFHG